MKPSVADSVLRLPTPQPRFARYLLAVGIVAVVTMFRFAMDPLIHDQIPFFIYTAAVVVATWFCGVEGGVLSTILSAFVGNFFFVPPRHELLFSHDDVAAMSMFSLVSFGLVWTVGRWRRAERAQTATGEAARQRAEELQAILDTVPAAVFVTHDPDARRIDANRYAADALRVPVGSNTSMTAPANERPTTFRTMRNGKEIPGTELPVQVAVSRGAEVRDWEVDFVFNDGSTRTLFGNATPLRDAVGRVRGAVAAFVDVTERKRMETRLQQQTARLQEQAEELATADRMKDEFLATLSHELRTPLNAIVGWSDMLRRGTLQGDSVQRAIESINRNARAQSELINDVLDVSRIISGKVRIDAESVDVAMLLEAALESVRPAAEAKRLTVTADCASVPATVSGDAARLQQVFWNLLSNAVKFTPANGQIRVSLRFADDQLQVQVVDSGIGIDRDFLPHVFERFRQRDSSSTRTQSGLGLGLAIVRHLVELHGGTVTAESAGDGQGATFTVTLPARPFEERRHGDQSGGRHVQAVVAAAEDPPALCGLRVLIVDDEDDAREVTASALLYHGANVAVAANAGQALEQFDPFRPDVLLIDLAMPEMDGYALIERIRTSRGEKGARVPAIALTAYAREEDARRALSSGFQLHIAKPVYAHTLARAVASVARDSAKADAS